MDDQEVVSEERAPTQIGGPARIRPVAWLHVAEIQDVPIPRTDTRDGSVGFETAPAFKDAAVDTARRDAVVGLQTLRP